jgi:hypothetical protein
MATKEAPHLLTLPREIRDSIYSHLRHEVVLRCQYESLQLQNAPIVAVLLTHSQLYHEYKETDYYKNLSCKLCWQKDFPYGRITAIKADSRALSQINHLELSEAVSLDSRYYKSVIGGPIVRSDEAFIRDMRMYLLPMLSRLRTLRFHTWYYKVISTDYVCLDSAHYVAQAALVSTSLPHAIRGLKMIQVATGCTLSPLYSIHRLSVITSYVYANTKVSTNKANICSLAEVEGWVDGLGDGLAKYSPSGLEKFKKEREDISVVLNAEVLGWTDRRMA